MAKLSHGYYAARTASTPPGRRSVLQCPYSGVAGIAYDVQCFRMEAPPSVPKGNLWEIIDETGGSMSKHWSF